MPEATDSPEAAAPEAAMPEAADSPEVADSPEAAAPKAADSPEAAMPEAAPGGSCHADSPEAAPEAAMPMAAPEAADSPEAAPAWLAAGLRLLPRPALRASQGRPAPSSSAQSSSSNDKRAKGGVSRDAMANGGWPEPKRLRTLSSFVVAVASSWAKAWTERGPRPSLWL